jgi:VWFA-related protein
LAGAVLALAAGGAGAQPLERPATTFGETIDVRVINVEVVVLDKDGVSVLGLQPGDFRLLVGGKEVPIEYFTEIRGGIAIDPPKREDGGGPSGLPSVAPGEPVPTSYLVFIDDYFSVERDRDQVLDALAEQLPLLGPKDRMAVVAFDGTEISMLSSWSGSSTQLRRALQDARARPALGIHRVAELRFFENTRTDQAFDRGAFDLSFEEQQYARQLAGQVERSVNAATATLRGFASPPGRRVMLLLSGGWPFSPAAFAVNEVASQQAVLDSTVPDGFDLFDPLVRTANLLGYTLYPVDVPGLSTGAVTGAAEGGPSRNPDTVGQASLPAPTGARFTREFEQEQSLRYVAEGTGGKPLINGLRLAAFEQAVQDTRTYYWLGFSSERREDKDKRNIRVEVLRKGLEVRSRESFQELSRQQEVSLAVESALLFGSPPGFDNLPLQAGELEEEGRRFLLLPLLVAIPTDTLTVVPDGESFLARLELRIAAVSEKGDQSDIPVIPLELRLEEQPAPGKFIPYQTKVKLRRQKQRVVVALYDLFGSTLHSNVLDLDPPPRGK